MQKKKILVTGAAGFIGMHTSIKLLSQGYDVVGLDSLNSYYVINLKYSRLQELGINYADLEYGKLKRSTLEGFQFIHLKLEEREALFQLFQQEKFDYVIHLAAQAGVRYSLEKPFAYLDSNLDGFMNMLEACRHNPVKHLIFASSSSVYGLNREIPFQESQVTAHPVSLYAATKKANEMLAHSYSSLYQLPCTGLRFFTVYGPWGRPDMALFIFTSKILDGKPIQVFNNGDMSRDFTYVGDIVNGMTGLIDLPPSGSPEFDAEKPDPGLSNGPYRILNIGNSKPVKLMDFIKILENELGKEAIIEFKPLQKGDVHRTYADTSRLKALTGYQPSTELAAGVKAFVDWYRNYYQI
jgi:UDP-glucuronate 4-epimerase